MIKTAAGRELLTGALVAGATAAASALAGNSANTRKLKRAEGAHATGEAEGVDAVPQDVIASVAGAISRFARELHGHKIECPAKTEKQ